MRLRFAWLLFGLSALCLRADADWKSLAARFPQAMSVVEDSRDTYDVSADGKYAGHLPLPGHHPAGARNRARCPSTATATTRSTTR